MCAHSGNCATVLSGEALNLLEVLIFGVQLGFVLLELALGLLRQLHTLRTVSLERRYDLG